MKIYIAGKISGLEIEIAKIKFNNACYRISKQGHTPVNPFDSGLPDNAPYEEHIKADLEMMYECDAVAVLPNWTDSKGAINEVNEAIKRGMPIIAI
ncbi:MAG: DUF4406 domain-containing protein [Tannerellaceae bacterium]